MNTTVPTIREKQEAKANHQHLLAVPENLRTRFFASATPGQQKELRQFLTPPHVADLMAAMFQSRSRTFRLLDAGAGMGILSAAFVRRQLLRKKTPNRIEVTAYEMDKAFVGGLENTYEACRLACQDKGIEFYATIRNVDFIAEGVEMLRNDLFSQIPPSFDVAIVNPPYGKLSTKSASYRCLRSVGAETTNLYTAFLNLIIGLLKPRGELVAITPRSFCNGPYFKPFRKQLLSKMSFCDIHVFESRKKAFKHDRVLQENIILHTMKALQQNSKIRVSQSFGGDGDAVYSRVFPAFEIVSPRDPEAFIHIPTSSKDITTRNQITELGATLPTLGLKVSTGRVVDFRARKHIRQKPDDFTAPLIYPCHFDGLFVTWPRNNSRKPNAILDDAETQNLLIPAGVYVLIKRFTSKEERRRVVACIYDPSRIRADYVGFENHLNYIHAIGRGIDITLAKGLWAFLNSTLLDQYFRQFNGHTQVNANDLCNVRYPSAEQLHRIGHHVRKELIEQKDIDQLVSRELKE